MRCRGCRQDIPAGSRFCLHCGSPLTQQDQVGPETTKAARLTEEDADELPPEQDSTGLSDHAEEITSLPPGTGVLLIERGPDTGTRFLLDRDVLTVGRHPDSDIFLDDVTVSRRHAEFYRDSSGFSVRDVESLNGTYVNRQATRVAPLASGDRVEVGKFRLIYLTCSERHPNGAD
jgi:pSer/pThr/pTyr-binding forkhead associated (FHA) protein